VKDGARVVILDDVITRGSSSVKAIKEVQAKGCKVVLVLTLVDRLQGAAELFRAEGVTNFQSIFTIRDFGVEADASEHAEKVPLP
jgi:orotate phosphoribosyltransferase